MRCQIGVVIILLIVISRSCESPRQFHQPPVLTPYRIFQLEKSVNQPHNHGENVEASPLIGSEEDPDSVFRRALDVELDRVCSFYQLKELELCGEVTELKKDADGFDEEGEGLDSSELLRSHAPGRTRHGSLFQSLGFGGSRRRRMSLMSASIDELGEDPNSDNEDDDLIPSKKDNSSLDRRKTWDANGAQSIDDLRSSREAPSKRRMSQSFEDNSDQGLSALVESGLMLKKRATGVYVSLCELKSYIQLNKNGFSKATKKYDKVLNRNIRSAYVKSSVETAYPFRPATTKTLDENISIIEAVYAKISTKGDISLAKRELRLHLREQVVWERNTIWRDMIGIERKAQAANLGIRRPLLGANNDSANAQLQGDEPDSKEIREIDTPVGRVKCPRWLFSSTFFTLMAIVIVFVIFLNVPIMEKQEQQRCLALVVFVSLLWATEVIPLFVTALTVPFFVVCLNICRTEDTHRRMTSKESTKYIFAAMWTPVIMLLLGGFTIAAALSKYHIAKLLATFVLSKAGTRPRTVLLTNMFVAMVASMWISNVAAPVLCYSIIQPLLRNLPPTSTLPKSLVLGIALASNFGGAASPIASPQNIIALQNMLPAPSWGIWFFIALPICIIAIVLVWLLLLATFRPGKDTNIIPIRPMKDRFTGTQYFISAVTLLTIVLWCVSHQLEHIFGDMGVIAIIPLVMFFGTGILTKEDFNNFLWTIIILAAGGLSLGKAVSSSGLLETIATGISSRVEHVSLYAVFVTFCLLVLVVATFISHTVAALIILPLVHEVGQAMPEPHPNLLVMGTALMASGACGLPVSGFPNMTAIMMEDQQTGKRYLRVGHFLTRGIPSSIIYFGIVISVGYGLLLAAGL